jgi:hypothetical protein
MTSPTLTNVTNPRRWSYGFALDDRLFRLAVGPGRGLSIKTAPLEAPRVNTDSSPEEIGETDPNFARSEFDGGEGLFRAHLPGAAANRFWDSKNVSVQPAEPGEFPEVRLLKTTANIEASADTGLYAAEDGTSLYVTEGTVLRRTDDPTAASPTWANDDPHNGEAATTVGGVAILGSEVYAALGTNGIHRKSSGAWSHWNDLAATRIWASKGRVVASDGRSLYEVTAAGVAPSPLKTLSPGESWQDATDGGSHILCAATDGYIYAFSTDSGSMVLAAQSLFEGETPRTVGQTQGVVAVGTAASNVGRLWVGTLLESGQLDDMQLVKQWGESGTATDQTPRRIIGTREALFTAVPDGTDTYLWRFDLSSGGLARHLTIAGASGLVRGLAVVDGRLFATVDASGVWREGTTYASSGYLIGPLGDFFSASDKSWIGARLETGTLSDGRKVELFYTTDPDALNDPDSSSWVRVTTRDSGSGDPGEHALSSVVARSLAGMVKLAPSTDATQTPAVRSFSFRAYPSSGDEDVIVVLPANVSDQIERPGRHRSRPKGRGATEYAALLGFEGRPVTLRLFRPAMTVRGLVEEVGTPIQAITSRGSVTVVSQVRVRGRRAGSGTTSGVGTFGTYHLFGTQPNYGEVA